MVEAWACELQRAHLKWGVSRIVHELMRDAPRRALEPLGRLHAGDRHGQRRGMTPIDRVAVGRNPTSRRWRRGAPATRTGKSSRNGPVQGGSAASPIARFGVKRAVRLRRNWRPRCRSPMGWSVA